MITTFQFNIYIGTGQVGETVVFYLTERVEPLARAQ